MLREEQLLQAGSSYGLDGFLQSLTNAFDVGPLSTMHSAKYPCKSWAKRYTKQRQNQVRDGGKMHVPLGEHAFAGAFRAGDSRRFGLDLKKDRAQIILAATAAAKTGFATYGPIHSTVSNGRQCCSVKDYSQTLILRILAKFIAKRFRVDINNRDRMVRGVIESLADSTPIYIVRRDISSFYETIPTQGLIKRLTQDIFIPTLLRQHLNCFFETFCPPGSTGIPRGVCVSPILAELAMEAFDKAVKGLTGVYKYFRYSDDIIIFSYLPTTEIELKLPHLLLPGMVFSRPCKIHF